MYCGDINTGHETTDGWMDMYVWYVWLMRGKVKEVSRFEFCLYIYLYKLNRISQSSTETMIINKPKKKTDSGSKENQVVGVWMW